MHSVDTWSWCSCRQSASPEAIYPGARSKQHGSSNDHRSDGKRKCVSQPKRMRPYCISTSICCHADPTEPTDHAVQLNAVFVPRPSSAANSDRPTAACVPQKGFIRNRQEYQCLHAVSQASCRCKRTHVLRLSVDEAEGGRASCRRERNVVFHVRPQQ